MVFRFLHLADTHLETRFGGRPEARERLRAATLEAFESAAEHTRQRNLHALLIAGDLFDEELLSVQVELRIERIVRELAEAGIHVLIAAGNHDPGGEGRALTRLGLGRPGAAQAPEEAWRSRVHLFLGPTPEVVQISDVSGTPVGIVVGAGHEGEREPRNLAARFRRLDTELPVVGLLHTQVDTARGAERHDRYAPSSRADFEHLDYAYFALGHVHVRQRAFDDLPVWYAGNLVGRNMRETGPKGGLEVEARAGAWAEPTFLPFASVRQVTLELDGLEPYADHAALFAHLAHCVAVEREHGSEELCVRLGLTGATPLYSSLSDPAQREMLEEELIERCGAVDVVLDDRGLHRPWELARLRKEPTVLGRALELLEGARRDDALLARLAPDALAGCRPRDEAERARYLRELLGGLEHELVERCLAEDPS